MQPDSKTDSYTLAIPIAIMCGNLEDLKKSLNEIDNKILIQYLMERKPIFSAIYCLNEVPIGSENDLRRVTIFNYLFKKMMALDPELINLYDNGGITALHSSIMHNRFDLVKELLEVNVDLKNPKRRPNDISTEEFAKMRLSPEEFSEFQKIIKERYPQKAPEDTKEVTEEIRSRKSSMFTEEKKQSEVLNKVKIVEEKSALEQEQVPPKNLEEDNFQMIKKVRSERETNTVSWFMSLLGIGGRIHGDDKEDKKVLDESESEPLINHKME